MQKHAFKDLSKNSCSMDLRVIEKVLEGIKPLRHWGKVSPCVLSICNVI